MPLVLRLMLVTTMAASLVAVTPSAGAHHRPNFYCSESGDLCQSVRKVDGVRRLGITLVAGYFRSFQLCVRDPEGAEVCSYYRIRERSDGTFGRDVRWRDHIWYQRTLGPYTVTWRLSDGTRIGRRLGFHVR